MATHPSLPRGTTQVAALDTVRQLVAQCGPHATLSEFARYARKAVGPERCSSGDGVIGSLLDLRLRDLVELARNAQESHPPHASDASDGDAAWTAAVREILFAHLDRPALSLPVAARRLAVSARTLQRRLADEGTTWRAEIDAARRERAASLLQQGTTSDVTAARLGYSESRALRRALRRWGRERVDASSPQVGASCPPRGCGGLT
jgi:AraC-like DNA-binding protein